MSGRVQALTNYRFIRGGEVIKVATDGKYDVSSDFDALMLEELIADDAPDIVGILDGAAEGIELSSEERAQIRVFRERLRSACERHNERLPQQATGGS